MYPSMWVAGQAIDAESRFLSRSDLTEIERILRVWPTTGGCPLFDGTVVEREAVCLADTLSAGAIIIGKTKLREVTAGNQDNPWQVSVSERTRSR